MNKQKLISKIPIIIISLGIIVGAILLTLSLRVNSFSLTTLKKSYSYVCRYEESQEMEVLVYVSSKQAYVCNKNRINNAYIQSKDGQEQLLLEVKNVSYLNIEETIKDKNYYLYSFVFNIPLITTDDYNLNITDAIILLEYSNNDVILNIGNFDYYKVPYYGDKYSNLTISKIKPIVGVVYRNKTLTALNIKFRNNSNTDLLITNVKLYNEIIYSDNKSIKEIDYEIKNSDTVSSILGYNYQSIATSIPSSNTKTNLNILKNSSIEYIIPLKYCNDFIINSLGLMIEYEINGQQFYFYYDDFILFTDANMNISSENFIISTYEND